MTNKMVKNSYLGMVLKIVQADKITLFGMALLVLLSSLADFIGLSLIAPFVLYLLAQEEGSTGIFGYGFHGQNTLVLLGLAVIFAYTLKAALSVLIQWKIIRFSNEQLLKIRCILFARISSSDYIDIVGENTSDYIYDVQTLTGLFSGKVLSVGLRLFTEVMVCLAVLGALAFQNIFIFTMLVFLFSTFLILYNKLVATRVSFYGKKVNFASDDLIRSLSESLTGFKEIKVLGKENLFIDRFSQAAKSCSENLAKADFITSIPRYVVELLMIYFIGISCFLLFKFDYKIAEMVAVMSVFAFGAIRLIPSVNAISRAYLQLRFSRNATERLFERLNKNNINPDRMPELASCGRKVEKFEKLLIKNVSFSYEANKPVLVGVSLEIKANEVVGIVGESGSGKSTLVDIILGFLSPNSGEVIINSKPLNGLQRWWLDMVAYLPQETLIVDESLRYNICLSKEKSEDADQNLFATLKRVGLEDFDKLLNRGLDSRLGENGSLLSGGQRQRVAIARAFLHNRPVLVLDEITSALDDGNEELIVKELESLKQYCTIILITHRKKLLRICDKIYNI
jgi:ABC-type multidrug transport system fused ATPase/permease subunit